MGLLAKIRAWTSGNRTRSLIIAGALGAVMLTTLGAWLYLASVAAAPPPVSIDDALAALDKGEFEYAEALAQQIVSEGQTTTEAFGGPPFVIGAIRARQAESQWSEERRQSGYYVASRYLEQAKNYGFPEGREAEGLQLLGTALVESDQLERGIEVLEESLAEGAKRPGEAHRLLSEAMFFAAHPLYQRAADHAAAALASGELEPVPAAMTRLRRAQCLNALGQYDRALAESASPDNAPLAARARLIEGQVRLARIRRAKAMGEPTADEEARAEAVLAEALDKDAMASRVTGAAQYLQGGLLWAQGREAQALERFIEVRSSYSNQPEGVAAAVAEGDLLRGLGDAPKSLDAYRRALSMVSEATDYRNEWLPIAQLRDAVLAAQSAFVSQREFGAAAGLVEQIATLFGKDFQLELKARTLEAWGDHLLASAAERRLAGDSQMAEGRRRLREAGQAYEQLAAERFSTSEHPDHLWRAAEVYYRGQSFSSAERTLREYLKQEPERRNATALLRLGQAQLAQADSRRAVATLRECIEFHPGDPATYQARLDCSTALEDQGDLVEAETLLRYNLVGSTLSPRSPEWRDSLFRLGRMLHAQKKYEEAINRLEEAIERYPDDPQSRLAQYLVADAYRHAAKEPMQAFEQAQTVNERNKNLRLAQSHLTNALKNYDKVQREITLSQDNSPLDRAMLRNCYMLKGAVLFDLERYQEAAKEYSNVSTLFQNEPFVLETLVQVSNCWRRLNDPEKARGAIDQALAVLERLPPDADFAATTTLTRSEWESMLAELRRW